MLLNAGKEERSKGSRVATLLGVPGATIGAVLVAWTLVGRFSTTQSVAIGALWGDPKSIARLLFHDFLLPFEITSVLILIAIMGAVVLASRPEAVARPHLSTPVPQPMSKKDRELVATGKDH
jgi:NADH-quinone oxidoreductase subunit J